MSDLGTDFFVDTQPTKEVVVSSLTKDASIEACIFDLIDNAIDAARERLFEKNSKSDSQDIPDDFGQFEISLSVDGSGVNISDNCGGIPVEILRDLVLRFGKPSSQELGIGVYGVGLNRAIFKLGRSASLKTDTGKTRAELSFDVEDYLADDKNWGLPAKEFETTGSIGTDLQISRPSEEILETLESEDFQAELKDDISRRYCKFLDRNLIIVMNGEHVVGHEVQMRENGPFAIERKFYKTRNGVSILIRVGEHEDHRFKGEAGYDQNLNNALTHEYGWTVFCNDRAIVVSDVTRLTGWDTRFHSEFYGFVATVDFLSSDPSLLPWNTTKTDLDLNNSAYKLALEDMRTFAERWRRFTAKYKKLRKDGEVVQIPPAPEDLGKRERRPKPKATPQPEPPKIETRKKGHNDLRFVLPDDINEYHCQDKFLEIVREAKTLDVATHPYLALASLRMLFEFSLMHFMIRNKRGNELFEFIIKIRQQKSQKKISNKNKVSPKLEESIAFLEENPNIWGDISANHMAHSIRKLKGYLPEINGALHNPFQTINRSKAFQIRDEALPGLRHLIEYPLP